MSRDRIDRKQLKRPDGFVQKGRQIFESLFREPRMALIALGVVGVGVAAYYAYDAYASRRLNRDWISYYQADEAKGADRTTKMKAAFEGGGNTRAALAAAVFLADHYYGAAQMKAERAKVKAVTGKEAKKPKEGEEDPEPALNAQQAAEAATDWYGKALGFSLLLPGEREMLTLDAGHALELQGKWDEALGRYQSVVQMEGQAKPLAMLHSGRMHEVKKEKDAAKTLYQSISQEFANTEYARLAKNYLRTMDSALLETTSQP